MAILSTMATKVRTRSGVASQDASCGCEENWATSWRISASLASSAGSGSAGGAGGASVRAGRDSAACSGGSGWRP